ncbi:MAG: hypothetical protein JKY60_02425 [Kordiimonadaceae bacterium]|nr:hypothetical protein [Kordiimonadaceae bacterium]
MKKFGFKSPQDAVGQTLTQHGDKIFEIDGDNVFEIVGVVANHHFESLRSPYKARVYYHDARYFTKLTVQYTQDADIAVLVQDIETVWNKLVPNALLQYSFMDQNITAQYGTEQKQLTLLFLFSALALFVAMLGLYGFVAFSAESRRMEIGIRKIHGASLFQITSLLISQLFKAILLANFIAWPITWYLMTDYLENFAFRIDLSTGYFIFGGAIVALAALVSMAAQVVTLARTRPVETIRV